MKTKAPLEPKMGSVFISYSRQDLKTAEALLKSVEDLGYDAFLDTSDIAPGEDWRSRLSELIASSEKVFFLISPSSVASEVCDWEVNEAERLSKTIVPIIVEETPAAKIPSRLSRLNYIFWRGSNERKTNLPIIVKALGQNLEWEREGTKITKLASEWDKGGRSKRLLTTIVDQVRTMEKWRDVAPHDAPQLSSLQMSFISASREAVDQRLRRFLITALCVTGLTAILAVSLYYQSIEAENQRDTARTHLSNALSIVADMRSGTGELKEGVEIALNAWELSKLVNGCNGQKFNRQIVCTRALYSLESALNVYFSSASKTSVDQVVQSTGKNIENLALEIVNSEETRKAEDFFALQPVTDETPFYYGDSAPYGQRLVFVEIETLRWPPDDDADWSESPKFEMTLGSCNEHEDLITECSGTVSLAEQIITISGDPVPGPMVLVFSEFDLRGKKIQEDSSSCYPEEGPCEAQFTTSPLLVHYPNIEPE